MDITQDGIAQVFSHLLGESDTPLTREQETLTTIITRVLGLNDIESEKARLQEDVKSSKLSAQLLEQYLSKRDQLRITMTDGHMNVASLLRSETKIVTTGTRRRQQAQVNLTLDNASAIRLELDARALEKLLSGIKDAQSEADLALKTLRTQSD
jgi:hypothetical protein